MKLKELRTYQSVKFQGQECNFFHNSVRNMSDIKLTKLDWGILVETERDQAVVTFNNIAYAKPEERLNLDEPKEKKSSK